MIIFLHTAAHSYTHKALSVALGSVRQMSYEVALSLLSLPRATYVFTDMDRLSAWQLELTAHLYQSLKAAGCRVLNDPARVLVRLPLLRRLASEKLNAFSAWPASEAKAVERFPVFLRTASAHRGNLTDLVWSPDALSDQLEMLLARGYPISDLIVVEYCAEPLDAGVFRKLSMYRVGEEILPSPSVHQRHWVAKYGEAGVAGDDGYAEDLVLMKTQPYRQSIERAFHEAAIDYGRADFGVVRGRPQVYEINTNPSLSLAPSDSAAPSRREAEEHARAHFLAAVSALDSEGGGRRIRIPRPFDHGKMPRRRRIYPSASWIP